MRDGEILRFRGGRERALLALLVLNANRVVSAERLAEDLWSGEAPEGAVRSLRVYVSRVRQALGDPGDVLVTRPSGYLLQVDPALIDAARFDALVTEGRAQAKGGDQEGASTTFRAALALWRGPALADVASAPFAQAEAARLEEARLAAVEECIDADLECGRHGELASELDALTRANPLRERLWAQRITALYRAERQADALRAYQELRHTLGEQLGIEPSAALRSLEGAVLRHDPELDLRPSPRAAGGVVTFLFTDVVGSTELLGQLGENAAEELRQAHFGALREAVAGHGGEEVKSLGDGLMVTFTSPLAALNCAVAMQQAMASESGRQTRPVQVRIGVHAGEPMRDEGDYYGTPVVVAKRLCDLAEGGRILASALVCDLAGRRDKHGFTFRHLGGLPLKGLAEPVAACEVVWGSVPAPVAPSTQAAMGPLPLPLGREEPLPLVGRTGELHRLQAAWTAARSGQRRLVLVGGEPGIGKSRLTTDFAREVHADGGMVLLGRCNEGLGVPYQPFVEALGRYLRDSAAPDLGRLAGELVRLVPEVTERIPGLPLPLRSDPEMERFRLFEAVAAWLAAISGGTPVLFAIEDLHWATKPTLLLLSHLVRSDEDLSLLLMVNYRDSALDVTGDLADAIAELFRQPGVERLSLSGLDQDGVAALMEAQARHGLDEEGWALARVLHTETAGNPFFVREMLRHLAEKGALVQRDGRWMAGQPVGELDVPDSVREVVGRRLTRLPDKTDEVLAVAAVLGERFELPVLVHAVGESMSSVLGALDPAVAARLVEETDIGSYHFAHALVRSTLEDALGPTRRAQLHLRVAEAIEATFAGRMEGRAAVLAAHYRQAASLAPPERAIDASIQAGREAAAALAWEEVARHWQAALELMDRTQAGSAGRADLLARLADLLYVTGFDLPGSIAHVEKAITIFAEQGDQQRVAVLRSRLGGYLTSNPVYGVMDLPRGLREFEAAERVLEQEPDNLSYGYLQGTLAAATGIWAMRPDEALSQSQRGMDLAERHGHDGLGVISAMLHAFSLLAVGSVGEGIALVERAWEAADRLDHRIFGMRAAHIRTVWALCLNEPLVVGAWSERELARPRLAQAPIQRRLLQGQLAWAYVLTGRVKDAKRVLDEAGGLPVGVTFAPPLELWLGDWEAAEAVLSQWRDRYREMGNTMDAVLLRGWFAQVLRLRGDEEGAAASLEDALAMAVPAHHRVFEAGFRIDLGSLALRQGELDRARQHLSRARELIGEDWRGLVGRLAVAEAAAAVGEGDLTSAQDLLHQGIEILRRHQLPWEEADALLLWGRAVGRAGDGARARERLDEALAVYERVGAAERWRVRVEAERACLS